MFVIIMHNHTLCTLYYRQYYYSDHKYVTISVFIIFALGIATNEIEGTPLAQKTAHQQKKTLTQCAHADDL